MDFLIAGLGNIGSEYELSRHNAGFLALDQFADVHGAEFSAGRYAAYGSFRRKGRHVHLIKPTTYMNESGKAVRFWLQKLRLTSGNLLVVVDDIALPFGSLRMRAGGSTAGHNGLKDITAALESQEYPRLRMGIGANFTRGNQVDYVLEKFTQEELGRLEEVFKISNEMIDSFCLEGVDKTMSIYNSKTGLEP